MAVGLAWVTDLCRLLLAEGATVDDVVAWLGGGAERRESDRVLVERPARLAALNVVIAEEGGRPASVSAWYARGDGPTLDEAMDDLGPWTEYPRPRSPYQGTFEPAAGQRCEVIATTYDPPELEGERRLVEIAVLMSPEE